MTEHNPSRPAAESPKPGVNWAIVAGFAAMAPISLLLNLTGVSQVIGELATALIAFVAVGAVWVLGAGFGGVPRPVLTLTFAGALFGAVTLALGAVFGVAADYGPGLVAIAALIEIGRAAGLGALAGALALAIQRSREKR